MKLKIIIVLAITLSLASCNIQELTVGSPKDVKVEELSMKAVKLELTVPIENPNNFSFKVKNVNLDLIVNGRNVGKVKKMDKVQIPANSKGNYPVSFEITPSDALTNILFLMPVIVFVLKTSTLKRASISSLSKNLHFLPAILYPPG